MNDENSVNDVITDSVSQITAINLGTSIPNSLGMLDITGTETIGMSMFNAVTTQQNAQISASAAITATCARIIQTQPIVTKPAPAKEKDSPPPFLPLDGNGLSKLSSAQIKKLAESLEAYFNSGNQEKANPKKVETKSENKALTSPVTSPADKPAITSTADNTSDKGGVEKKDQS